MTTLNSDHQGPVKYVTLLEQDQHLKAATIRTPADIYRVFIDVVNGEYVPCKSILKSQSRENSVCSDISESSDAEFDDRREF